MENNNIIEQKIDPYAALRVRDYLFYTVGRLLLIIGRQVQNVAVGWDLYVRTGSALVIGVIGLVEVVPVILFTFWAGDAADRFNRKTVILCSLVLQTLCFFGMAAVSYTKGPLSFYYILLFVGAVGNTFYNPASAAILPLIVPMEIFRNAVEWGSSGFQFGLMVGPVLGGCLLAVGGASTAYVAAAMTALLCFLCIAMIRPQTREQSTHPPDFHTLVAGLHFVWNTKVILAALTLDLFAVLFGGAVALLPIYAKDILHVGPTGLGWMRCAPAVGAMIMLWILAHRPPMKQAGKTLILAVIGFGIVTVIFGFSRWLWLSLLMLGLIGAFDSISVVIRHTLVQVRTPDPMRGRVSAVNSLFISNSNELGWFESGLTAWLLGPVISVVAGGALTVLIVLGAAWIWPELRELKTLGDNPTDEK